MNQEDLEELASRIGVLVERVTELTYDALREQSNGNEHFKEIEKKLSTVRRSLVKAEATLRNLA